MGCKKRVKPEEKPVTYGDLISGWDRFSVGDEVWEVTRRLMPDHAAKTFGMVITAWEETRILRGVNKGGHRVKITVEYIDDIDKVRMSEEAAAKKGKKHGPQAKD
jgi:hypothetical protein